MTATGQIQWLFCETARAPKFRPSRRSKNLRRPPICVLRILTENDECPFCIPPNGPYALKKENKH
jgi:hypothetical protein